jgi:hypothetical protein
VTSAKRQAIAHPATVTAALVAQLTRAGWTEATPTDRYTRAAGVAWYQPVRPRRSGHTPARVTLSGAAVALSTFDAKGAAFEQVSWGWVDPGNLERVAAYIAAAFADALAERGEA